MGRKVKFSRAERSRVEWVVECFLIDLSSVEKPPLVGQPSTHGLYIFFNAGPLPKGPTTDSLEVLAAKSFNATLSCWIDFDRHDFPLCSVDWYLNDNKVPLKRGEKYKRFETETSRCKKEFILSIFNITENDRGTYSCHWICEFQNNTKAAVDLKVYDNPSTGKNIERSNADAFIFLSIDCSSFLLIYMDFLMPVEFN